MWLSTCLCSLPYTKLSTPWGITKESLSTLISILKVSIPSNAWLFFFPIYYTKFQQFVLRRGPTVQFHNHWTPSLQELTGKKSTKCSTQTFCLSSLEIVMLFQLFIHFSCLSFSIFLVNIIPTSISYLLKWGSRAPIMSLYINEAFITFSCT